MANTVILPEPNSNRAGIHPVNLRMKISGKQRRRLLALLCICTCGWGGSVALAQQQGDLLFREYHPSWGVIPHVRSPSFSYGKVQTGKLVAEASESLNYLSIDNLIVGSVGNGRGASGFQVLSSAGQMFYVDDIVSPKCAVEIVAQQVNTDAIGLFGVSAGNPVGASSVYIGEINFDNCH